MDVDKLRLDQNNSLIEQKSRIINLTPRKGANGKGSLQGSTKSIDVLHSKTLLGPAKGGIPTGNSNNSAKLHILQKRSNNASGVFQNQAKSKDISHLEIKVSSPNGSLFSNPINSRKPSSTKAIDLTKSTKGAYQLTPSMKKLNQTTTSIVEDSYKFSKGLKDVLAKRPETAASQAGNPSHLSHPSQASQAGQTGNLRKTGQTSKMEATTPGVYNTGGVLVGTTTFGRLEKYDPSTPQNKKKSIKNNTTTATHSTNIYLKKYKIKVKENDDELTVTTPHMKIMSKRICKDQSMSNLSKDSRQDLKPDHPDHQLSSKPPLPFDPPQPQPEAFKASKNLQYRPSGAIGEKLNSLLTRLAEKVK